MTWIERIERRVRAVSPVVVDTGFAAVMAIAAVVSVFAQDVGPDIRDPDWRVVFTAIGAAAPIAVRRRYPLGAVVASSSILWIHFALRFSEGAMPLVFYVLVYSVAVWSPPKRGAVGLAVGVGVITTFGILGLADLDSSSVLQTLTLTLLVWIAGQVVRGRRESAVADVRAAQKQVEIEQQRAARGLAEERLRIAQELHDVVAHSMSVVAVQAGMGSHLLDDDPDQARAALQAISDVSRSTLTEMRRLLGVLRADDGAGTGHAPSPALADLANLVDDVRAAGVPVTLRVDGEPHVGNPGMELSAYRIVQEALTNVIKHAGVTTCVSVRVRCLADALEVEVIDDGRGLAAPPSDADGSGHGLVGMRERVDVWGGDLMTGHRPGGGYRIRATLPFGQDR